MKKVVFINNLYQPYARGGAERIIQEKVEKLNQDQIKPIIITWKPLKKWGGWQPEKTNKKGITIYRFWVPNIFSYRNLSDHNLLLKFIWHLIDMFNIFSALIIYRILRKEKPDRVHTHNLMGIGFLTPLVVSLLSLRHFHTLHDVQLIEPSAVLPWDHTRDSMGQKIYSSIIKFIFPAPDKVIFPSDFLKKFYQKRGFFLGSKWQVDRYDMDFSNNSQNFVTNKETKNFLFVGSIEQHKGIHILIQAWNRLNSKQKDNKRLHIVGNGTKLPEVKDRLRQDSKVEIYGRIKHEKMPSIYQNCDLLIFPSVCIENNPNVIREALSEGLEVIAAKTGGVQEYNYEAVDFFTPGDVEQLVTKINKH